MTQPPAWWPGATVRTGDAVTPIVSHPADETRHTVTAVTRRPRLRRVAVDRDRYNRWAVYAWKSL